MACPVCIGPARRHATYAPSGARRTATSVECDRCGSFSITHALDHSWTGMRERNDGRLSDEEQALLPYLSAHLRQAADPIELTTENWRAFAEAHTRTPASRKQQRLLELLAQRSAPGVWVPLEPRLVISLLDMRDGEELEFFLRHLYERKLIERRYVGVPGTQNELREFREHTMECQLTPSAWELLEPVAGAGVPGTCFVAMSFSANMNTAFDEGIRAAVEDDCGLRVIRVDREHHNDNITDRILAGIRSAQFVVADFTQQRHGVYFEAGFALGLGRTVIWTCREDDLAHVHFDTRQYNHVVWRDTADLRRRLAERIKATVTLPVRLA